MSRAELVATVGSHLQSRRGEVLPGWSEGVWPKKDDIALAG
jgi:hypothetical protein